MKAYWECYLNQQKKYISNRQFHLVIGNFETSGRILVGFVFEFYRGILVKHCQPTRKGFILLSVFMQKSVTKRVNHRQSAYVIEMSWRASMSVSLCNVFENKAPSFKQGRNPVCIPVYTLVNTVISPSET